MGEHNCNKERELGELSSNYKSVEDQLKEIKDIVKEGFKEQSKLFSEHIKDTNSKFENIEKEYAKKEELKGLVNKLWIIGLGIVGGLVSYVWYQITQLIGK